MFAPVSRPLRTLLSSTSRTALAPTLAPSRAPLRWRGESPCAQGEGLFATLNLAWLSEDVEDLGRQGVLCRIAETELGEVLIGGHEGAVVQIAVAAGGQCLE